MTLQFKKLTWKMLATELRLDVGGFDRYQSYAPDT